VVKGGVLDGKPLSADEIRKLADLESREVLLAKMAGAMKASLTQAVYLFAAPLAQAARAVGALEAKAQQDPSVLAGGAGTPAPVAEEAPEAQETTEAADASDAPVAEETAAEAGSASTSAPAAEADSETSPSE
jgi:large subunit ribosomal protein L10